MPLKLVKTKFNNSIFWVNEKESTWSQTSHKIIYLFYYTLYHVYKNCWCSFSLSSLLLQKLAWNSLYIFYVLYIFNKPLYQMCNKKNLPASREHSYRAQLASLASLSAPRARDSIVALRAPEFLNVALRARSCALCIHSSLFLIIWYWSSNQFYNNITDDVNYTFSQSHSISFWSQNSIFQLNYTRYEKTLWYNIIE